MKKLFLSLVAILVLCIPSVCLDRTFVNKTYDPAVALMYDKDKHGDYVFRCTATAFEKISDGYLFVSAAHCVDDGAKVYLGGDQPNDTPLPAEVLAYGDQVQKLDFSVLKVKAPEGMYSVLPLGNDPTQKGERIFSISAPNGVGKAYIEGYISLPDIPTTQIVEESDWQHNILFDMLGGGAGSSGSTIVCEDQMKVCAIFIGHLENGMVAEPIQRFKQWWADVKAGKTARVPQRETKSVMPFAQRFPFFSPSVPLK